MIHALRDDEIRLPDGPRLALRRADGAGRGRADGGYTTAQCAADLAALCTELGFTGDREPVVAGASWGGNVALTLAAEHGGGLALVDGGPEGVEGQLANLVEGPDGFAVARLTRDHHREILHSLWADDPRPLFPRVQVPTLLAVALAAEGDDRDSRTEQGPEMAASLLPDSTTSLYVGAHHDLNAQQPDRLAGELLALAARAEEVRR